MRQLFSALVVLGFALLSGCAHQIDIAPNISKIDRDLRTQPKIKQSVGYIIPEEIAALEITTSGGGGDKVRYFPYRDTETGFYKMLTNVFESVTKIKNAGDKEAIARNKIAYVVTTEISTNSSSPSPFTWPPTHFSVDMTCTIKDPEGKLIDTKKVIGEGHAEFDEFKSDHGLAGKRASEDALLKMQARLLELGQPKLNTQIDSAAGVITNTQSAGSPHNAKTIGDELERLKSLFDRGILTRSEYEIKRKQLVEKL